MTHIIRIIVGPIQTNCYIAFTDEKKAVIVDPGFEAQKIKKKISEKKLDPVAVLLTHGHFDHISAAEEMRSAYNAEIFASTLEKETLEDINMNLTYESSGEAISLHADKFLNDGEIITPGGIKIKCISTPGHTAGGMCFYLPDDGILFSGDTLFRGSCGRTDFPGGNEREIVSSIKEKLFTLSEDTMVFTGHGPETDIAFEKRNNIILNY